MSKFEIERVGAGALRGELIQRDKFDPLGTYDFATALFVHDREWDEFMALVKDLDQERITRRERRILSNA